MLTAEVRSVPRPVSWLTRLAEIRRSVANSVRSHYERKDIERLFQLQPRGAQALILGIAPSAKVGRSYLLARGDLEGFLDRIAEGIDPASLLAVKAPLPRRSLRELVQNDSIPATLETAPANLVFEAGRLCLDFRSMEELAGSLMALAEILSDPHEFEEFERRYVPVDEPSGEQNDERHELEALYAGLRDLELTHAEESVLYG